MRRRSLQVLTNSGEKTFRQCARLFFYMYEECVRPIVVSEPMAVGTLQHLALEAWWLAAKVGCEKCVGSGDEIVVPRHCVDSSQIERQSCSVCLGSGHDTDSWLRAALQALAPDPDPFRRAAAEALMVAYHHRWSAMKWEGAPYDGAQIEVLGVEIEFSGPMHNPATSGASQTWQRGGKLDVLIRVAGDVWVLDHKVTSEDFSPGSDYRRRLRLDTQVSGYHVGARLLGHAKVSGFVYDVISRPGQRPKKKTSNVRMTKGSAKEPSRPCAGQQLQDETPAEYQDRIIDAISGDVDGHFARFEVTRLEEEERLAAQDTWQYGEMIRDARRHNRWPRNPSNCTAPGRSCAFLPVCEGTASLNDGTRYRKAETAHEELSGKKEAA